MPKVISSTYRRTIGLKYECIDHSFAIGHKIAISEPINDTYKRNGAQFLIERDDQNRFVITGLIPIKKVPGLFYGDYHRHTIGAIISDNQESISIILFEGHRPKFLKTRERKVSKYFEKQKRTTQQFGQSFI